MAFLRRRSVAGDDREAPPDTSIVRIADATPRQRLKVEGQVIRMRARPTSGQPSLVVIINDGSGSATTVWTGRRSIGGITLGRKLVIEGVARCIGDQLEFTNPEYTLLP
jgi:RecG-like helicase